VRVLGLDPVARPSRYVLLVDRSHECREVLRTVLQRRGFSILEASEPREGLALARRYHPLVVVVDLDSSDDDADRQQLFAESQSTHSSLVTLGKLARSPAPSNGANSSNRCVAKPYHYAPLVRTIEQLVERATAGS
jgi:DNA-binding NtrC family response regulator